MKYSTYCTVQYITQKRTLGDLHHLVHKILSNAGYFLLKDNHIRPIPRKNISIKICETISSWSFSPSSTPGWFFTVSYYTFYKCNYKKS